jgi:hypothetical protein
LEILEQAVVVVLVQLAVEVQLQLVAMAAQV